MSLFKKPNRNFRRREKEIEDEDQDTKGADIVKSKERNNVKNSDPNKAIKQTLLSFGGEFDEGDEEVFQVKKSAQSKKIRRQIDREKEERRKKNLQKHKVDNGANADDKEKTKNAAAPVEEVTIKIKNPIAGPVVHEEKILSGRSAEMVGYRSSSDDEDSENVNASRHRFTQPDHVKMLLKSGKIPDASIIHAVRKRRQQAREMGGVNYIPLEEDNNAKLESENKSRLIREDDNDGSDEDERITMSGIVSFAADREKRKEGLDTYIATDGEDDEKVEDDAWEDQQIRKGVSNAQLAAVVQQESFYQQYYMNNAGPTSISGDYQLPSTALTSKLSHISSVPSATNYGTPVKNENVAFSPSSLDDKTLDIISVDQLAQKLRDRLSELNEVYKGHQTQLKNLIEEEKTLKENVKKREGMIPALGKRYEFYQDLREYISILVECLDEKLPIIEPLEKRVIDVYQKKANEMIHRRRQDVRDQLEDLTQNKLLMGGKRDEERERRAAEREGRRIRRSKNRSFSAMSSHVDGMSSDDEITETTATTYRNQLESIESDASRVFEDVEDEYASIETVLNNFADWRQRDKIDYTEAFANVCLPKLLGPFLRMNILFWNPLNKTEDIYTEKLSWVNNIVMYSADISDTEESLRKDPDLQLLPRLIDQVVLPKLDQIVKAQWDPLSSRETRQLTASVRNILQYPFIAPKSKNFIQLMNTIIEKMKQSIENDLFIPIVHKQMYDVGKSNAFFQRQFMHAVKLFGNILKWHGIINDEILAEMANFSLMNRYLLMGIRTLQPLEAATKCRLIASYLPETWLKKSESALHLAQFFNHIRLVITQMDVSNPHGKESVEKLHEIIKYSGG